MGAIRKYAPHRRWTEEEERLLAKLSEKKTTGDLAKALGRSPSSVNAKRIALGIGSFTEQTDFLTLSQVAELVGEDKGTIGKTWRKYGLRFRKRGYYRVITEEVLAAFMEEHPERWRASKCDDYFFRRYPWFVQRLEAERAGTEPGTHYMHFRKWTNMEISRLRMLKRRGLSHREIAAELCRTKRAVDHKVMRMKKHEIL